MTLQIICQQRPRGLTSWEERNCNFDLPVLSKLDRLCPLESIICQWVGGYDRRLRILSPPKEYSDKAFSTFFIKDKERATATLAVEDLLRVYKYYHPIKEEIYNYTDMVGHTADPEWMAERDKKYNMRWSDRYQEHIISPKHSPQFILSYLKSSGAIIEIHRELKGDHHYVPRYHYVIKATLFKKEEPLWQEHVHVPEQEMLRHIERRRRKSEA